MAPTARAQTTIPYNDGDVSATPIVLDPSGTVLDIVSGAAEQSGVISGAGSALYKTGAGSITLSGANTYSTQTNILAGALIAGNDAAFGNSIVQVYGAGSTVGYRDGVTIGNSIGLVFFGGEAKLDVASGRAVQAGEIVNPFGNATVVKSGAGTLALTSANPFIGAAVRMDAGILEIGHARALGSGNPGDPQAQLVMNGGALRSAVTTTLTNKTSFNAGVTSSISAVAGQTLTFAPGNAESAFRLGANSTAVFGAAAGDGVVVLALEPTNYVMNVDATARIIVAAGTLQAAAGSGGLGKITETVSATLVGAGATLDFNDNSATINYLVGAGQALTGTSAATVVSLQNSYFTGNIAGAGGVAQLSGGTTILSGANTYAGGTTIDSGGVLQLGETGRAGSIVGAVVNDGTLNIVNADMSGVTSIISNGETHFFNATTAGGATITTNSPDGLVQFHDRSSAANAAIINDGALWFADDSTAGQAKITNNRDLMFSERARAGSAEIINNGGLLFGMPPGPGAGTDTASADNATITNNALVLFAAKATGGFAKITNEIGAQTVFIESSTAGNATIRNKDFSATVFAENSTAGDATIITEAGGALILGDYSTAGNATITTASGGEVLFFGNSTGGNARFVTAAGGVVDFDLTDGPGGYGKISAGSIEGAGNYYLGGNELTVGGNNLSTVVSGVIADGSSCGCGGVGASLVKIGSGVLTLNGQNTYTGPTTINSGKLVVGGPGSAGASLVSVVTVNSGGTIGGVGTIGGLIAKGGVVAPGNSIGTLNVAGNVSFGPGSVYQVEVGAAGQSDKIAAAGVATLTGGTVEIVSTTALAPGGQYTILTAGGGVTGTFASVSSSFSNSAFVALALSYDANSVHLSFGRTASFASVGWTRNQIAAGAAADSLGAGNPIFDAIILSGAAPARQAFDALSGEIHASAKGVLLDESRFVRDAVTDRLRQALSSVGATSMPVFAYAAGGPTAIKADDPRFAAWGQAFGSWGRGSSDANAASLSRSIGGFFLGADAQIAEAWRIGAAGGYSRSTIDIGGRRSSARIDSYHAAIYGGGVIGAFNLRAGAAYAWHDLDTTRGIAFPGFADQAKANYNARTAQIFGEVGYRMRFGWLDAEPFAALAYVNLDGDRFAERGGAAALRGAGGGIDAAYSTLGARFAATFQIGDATRLSARATLAWRHAFGDTTPTSALAFASGGAPFTIAGLPIGRDALVAAAGVDLALTNAISVGVSYDGQISRRANDHGVKGNIVWKF